MNRKGKDMKKEKWKMKLGGKVIPGLRRTLLKAFNPIKSKMRIVQEKKKTISTRSQKKTLWIETEEMKNKKRKKVTMTTWK